MSIKLRTIGIALFLAFGIPPSQAKQHPMESLGVNLFNTFRSNNFDAFFQRSIFSLNETTFRAFLQDIRNKTLRDNLIDLHKIPFPRGTSTQEAKWEEAFKHNWREQWRHIARNSRRDIFNQAFLPIIEGAEKDEIQWKTAKIEAVEVMLPVTWTNVGFHIKGDPDPDINASSTRTLFIDRNCSYRLRLDDLTYAKAFMVGIDEQDSEKAISKGIQGNGAGEGDVLIRFGDSTPDSLFYFCPDQIGAGGRILVKNASNRDKPNQRTDLLLTFSYGQPTRYYQIMIKEVLMTNKGPLFFERPQWIGEVDRPFALAPLTLP
jgi:hypothetical protein